VRNRTQVVTAEIRDILVCPACHGPIAARDELSVIECAACKVEYPVRFGVPIMLSPDLRQPRAHGGSLSSHKAGQVAFFDQDPDDDFGVIRPRGAPELYGRLMREKFRRSTIGLEDMLPGSTALVICGGSGLDAEFLVNAGARVILSDISLGVVLQARERSTRFGLGLALVVADAEALPFRDASVGVVYVHDGLHHLERPVLGLAEMARVAARCVSVSEPARSLATTVGIRLGWAEAREEAGNPVMRLTIDEIVGELRKRGFRPIRPHRYFMLYRHWPGRTMRVLSRPFALPLAVALLNIVNRVLGRHGNKLTVQAVRSDEV
jgi:uncharacterized protein YbaR (Trm112 family)/SAM-dependent methyltransferase